MFEIYPSVEFSRHCPTCKTNYVIPESLLWQGVHTCIKGYCDVCRNTYIINLPTAQGKITPICLRINDSVLFDEEDNIIKSPNWFSSILLTIHNSPASDKEINIERVVVGKRKEKVVILNCLNYVYGHSLLQFFNLDNLIKSLPPDIGIIVLIQPFLKWLVPSDGIQEVWVVNMNLKEGKGFYPKLDNYINQTLQEYSKVYLSEGAILPYPVDISLFTKTSCYTDTNRNPRITFIWREDPGRLWIKNWLLHKALVKSKAGKLLLPLHYIQVLWFLISLKRKCNNYQITIAGLGKSFKFPKFVSDQRVTTFNDADELRACQVYSESILVIGIHGSSMILPSAHASMTISIMPSKRWGNFGEDILPRSSSVREALFENRIIPISVSTSDLTDICKDMVNGKKYFGKKFKFNSSHL